MTDKADTGQTIGGIARTAGVHVEAVRYYERIGLLVRPPRALQRVRFIKRAQWLGFSLEEVAILLELAGNDGCNTTRSLAEKKLRLLRRKLEELAGVQTTLETLLLACARNREARCPLIDSLPSSGENLLRPAQPAPPRMLDSSVGEREAALEVPAVNLQAE